MMILGGMGAIFLALVLLLIARLPALIDSSLGGGGGWGQGEGLFSFLTRERPSYGGGGSVPWTEEEEDEDEDYDSYVPDYSYFLSRMEYSPLEEVLFPVEIYDPEQGGKKADPYRDGMEDCAARIGGTLFDFPVEWEDLTRAGFEPVFSGEEEKILLYPGETRCQTFEKNGRQVRFQICSHARTAQLLQDCQVSGFTAEETDSGFADIVLPCGVSLSEADRDALKEAYGRPDSEREENGTLLWNQGEFGGCLIRLDEEERVTACSYMDFSVPAAYQEPALPEGLVWEEEEAVLPDPPAEDGHDGVFRTSTGTYRVLQPLKVLLDDGWEIAYSEEDCPAGQRAWISLKKGEEEMFSTEVMNISPDLLPVEDCRIMEAGVYDGDAFLGIGPFETGMDWEAVSAAGQGIGDYSSLEDGELYLTYWHDTDYDADYLNVSGDDEGTVDEIYFSFDATANAAMDRMRESVRLP